MVNKMNEIYIDIDPIIVYSFKNIKKLVNLNKLLNEKDFGLFLLFIEDGMEHVNGSIYEFQFPESISDWRYEEYKIPKESRENLQKTFSFLESEVFKKSEIKIYSSW